MELINCPILTFISKQSKRSNTAQYDEITTKSVKTVEIDKDEYVM